MFVLISPAKTLDFKTKAGTTLSSNPVFQKEANQIAGILKKLSQQELAQLLHVNSKLAELNFNRFQVWQKKPDAAVLKQAILAFKGDVYLGLKAENFKAADFDFAQQHLRILSGLYGVLKPLDFIQPYRLEMGTELENRSGKNLYEFWGDKITEQVKKDMKSLGTKTIINLASKEYFKSLHVKKLGADIITPNFKEFKEGKYIFMSVFGKKARGLMSRFIIKNQITNPEQLKLFDEEGYFYNDQLSKGNEWVFTRENR